MVWTYWLFLGALFAAAGIGAGAFGAHALKTRISGEDLAIYETAMRYWMTHAVGICIVALALMRLESVYLKWAAPVMLLGVVIFSGSLIALVLTGQRWLGAVTPLGGVLLIISWLLIAAGAISQHFS